MGNFKQQTKFIEALFVNLLFSLQEHIENSGKAAPGQVSDNYLNKNSGKYALKRKIAFIRQELTNLEKMVDEKNPWE